MSPLPTVGLTISGNTPKANCLDNVRYCCKKNMTSFHLLDKSCGAQRIISQGSRAACTFDSAPCRSCTPPSFSSWTGGQWHVFSSFQLRKTSVLLSREAQHAHSVHAGGSVAAGGFCPAGGRWGRSTGDGEEGLSCPGNASVQSCAIIGSGVKCQL